MGDERAVYDRVRCVALTRIIYGDNHWKLAKAYSKLAQAYLEQRGQCVQIRFTNSGTLLANNVF